MNNHAVANLDRMMQELPYAEVRDLATQLVMAQENYVREHDNVSVGKIDRTARDISKAFSVWNEVINS